jgi:hypothetical protein
MRELLTTQTEFLQQLGEIEQAVAQIWGGLGVRRRGCDERCRDDSRSAESR